MVLDGNVAEVKFFQQWDDDLPQFFISINFHSA